MYIMPCQKWEEMSKFTPLNSDLGNRIVLVDLRWKKACNYIMLSCSLLLSSHYFYGNT